MATQNEQWQQVKDIVADNLDTLKNLDAGELKEFATKNSLMTKALFPKFKTVLKTKGINYEELREAASQKREEELAQRALDLAETAEDGPTIYLESAAIDQDGRGSFAIVDSRGHAVWYGRFFDDDRTWTPGDPASAELSAAEKAIWIAGKALSQGDHSAGTVHLNLTHPDIKEDELSQLGVRNNLVVIVEFAEDNAAVDMANTPGFQKWQEYDLTQLIGGED